MTSARKTALATGGLLIFLALGQFTLVTTNGWPGLISLIGGAWTIGYGHRLIERGARPRRRHVVAGYAILSFGVVVTLGPAILIAVSPIDMESEVTHLAAYIVAVGVNILVVSGVIWSLAFHEPAPAVRMLRESLLFSGIVWVGIGLLWLDRLIGSLASEQSISAWGMGLAFLTLGLFTIGRAVRLFQHGKGRR